MMHSREPVSEESSLDDPVDRLISHRITTNDELPAKSSCEPPAGSFVTAR